VLAGGGILCRSANGTATMGQTGSHSDSHGAFSVSSLLEDGATVGREEDDTFLYAELGAAVQVSDLLHFEWIAPGIQMLTSSDLACRSHAAWALANLCRTR
jgi:hypothetical protein